MYRGINMYKGFAYVALTTYTVLLMYWMMWGFGRSEQIYEHYRYNLVPFQTIFHYFSSDDAISWKNWSINIIGNIIEFIPFGLLLPIILPNKWSRLSIYFLLGLLLFEFIQLVSKRGVFDIDDFILNYVGFCIGYVTNMKLIIIKRLL